MSKNSGKYINHTGGAYGIDTYGCIIGYCHGFKNHVHFRPSDNMRLSAKLRSMMLTATPISDEDLEEARKIVNETLGTNYRNGIKGKLQSRNYFQVHHSDAVYCFSRKTGDSTISGGTNTALQLAIKFGKEAYVYDTEGFQWYVYNDEVKSLCELSEPPTLAYNYAIVGTRDVEDYKVKCNRTGSWISRKQYIGDEASSRVILAIEELYLKTLEEEALYEE